MWCSKNAKRPPTLSEHIADSLHHDKPEQWCQDHENCDYKPLQAEKKQENTSCFQHLTYQNNCISCREVKRMMEAVTDVPQEGLADLKPGVETLAAFGNQVATRIEQAEKLLEIQGCHGNWDYDPYMHGMYNGMELILATIKDQEVRYKDAPETWGSDMAAKNCKQSSSPANPPIDTAIDEGKECTGCGKWKPFSEYSYQKRKTYAGNYAAKCKACIAAHFREDYYEENKDKIAAKNEAWRRENWEHVKRESYRRMDREKNKARSAVNNAVKLGKFHSLDCEECGEPKTDFHHTNGYDEANYFTGVWLCRPHHAALHRELRRLELQAEDRD